MKIIRKLCGHFEFFILAGVTVLFMPFLGTGLTVDPVLMPRFVIWSFATFILCVCFAARLCTKDGAADINVLRRMIFFAVGGYFLLVLISLSKAINITESIHEVLKSFVSIAYLFFAANILKNNKSYIPTLVKTMMTTALLLCAISIFEFIENDYIFESATMAHRNLLSSALFLMLPFCLYAIFAFRYYWAIIGVISVSSILSIIFSLQSRSVWAGLLVSTAAAMIVIAFLFKRIVASKETKSLLIRRSLYITIVFVIVALVYAIYNFNLKANFPDHSVKQVQSTDTIKERFLMWGKSIDLVMDNPIFGVGAGNWKLALPSYGLENLTERSFKRDFFQRPHNDYIWVLSETGIFGFLLYLSIFIITIVYIIKIIIYSPDTNNKLLSFFIFWGIIGYMTISFFSFPKERIFHSIALMLMIAIVVSVYHQTFAYKKTVPRPLMAALIIPSLFLLQFAVINGYVRLKAEVFTKRAFAARRAQTWPAVILEIDRGYSAFATLDPMSTPLKWYRGEANFTQNNMLQALEDYKQAYKANPYHIHVLNDLGSCYETVNDHENAIFYYKKAIGLFPQFDKALINLGATYYNCGRYEEAYDVLRRCDPETEDLRLKKYLKIVKEKIDNHDNL